MQHDKSVKTAEVFCEFGVNHRVSNTPIILPKVIIRLKSHFFDYFSYILCIFLFSVVNMSVLNV
jgi:hypothetical protein